MKEYVLKVLPVVTGYDDSLLSSKVEFIYKIEENESILSLDDIISCYKK